ncbi:MIP/aquaporin family protein [Ramlibacter solisilvae]|uniref:Glycerol uptake facilitator or water-selective channels n=2 Tax=Ramlibacter tataouinensis TaxID=94132 RepID=A0A127K051_9BURK|nr:glycerol uptake facilitator or water-selective channels [Ramlibacter tataouinensis]
MPRALLAEFVGTAMLLCAVIGSGIMAERLSAGNAGVALLANTLATVFALYVLIETLSPISGAHFNPMATVVLAWRGHMSAHDRWPLTALYILVQLTGALAGAMLANAMFDTSILQVSSKMRTGPGQWLAEAVAAAGLMFVILRSPTGRGSALVAAYIGAAYWFTASTSFANPAAVFGRIWSDSFAGIAPESALAFVLAQFAGGAVGAWLASVFEREAL